MAITLPNLGLKVWNSPTDPYNSAQLAQNWYRVDEHDHSPGKGRPLASNSLADYAVTNIKLADGAVDTRTLGTGAVAPDALGGALAGYLGVSTTGGARRGKSIIATAETRTNTVFGLLPTPDRVLSVVLPTDGLIVVAYQATWQEAVAGAARAAIFVGTNQLVISDGDAGVSPSQAKTGSASASADRKLSSAPVGLVSSSGTAGTAADATTGQAPSILNGAFETVSGFTTSSHGGVCHIFAAAGTYDISVQFKASSGSVTVKNRKLWVWTVGF